MKVKQDRDVTLCPYVGLPSQLLKLTSPSLSWAGRIVNAYNSQITLLRTNNSNNGPKLSCFSIPSLLLWVLTARSPSPWRIIM